MSTPTVERIAGYPTASRPRRPLPPPGPPRSAPAEQQIPMPVLAGLATLCTALCLGNLFDGLRWWLLPSAGGILLAGVAGKVGRRLRTPRLVMPLLYIAAGWIYVIPVAAHGSDVGASISLAPSTTTWSGLRALADSAFEDIHRLSVPVPDRPGFLFLTVAGVYLIAALVDGIAAGLNQPAAAGVPLLALPAVPAAVVERGVGLMAFLAAGTAYLVLLLASGRRSITQWARLPPGAAPGIRRMTGETGRRIGAVALVAALIVPVLVPRYTGLTHRHHGGGSDGGSATVIEPVVTLTQQLHSRATQELLSVRTNVPEYLRLTALEHFDGQRFTLGSLSANSNARVSRGLPAVPAVSAQRVQATINVYPRLHQRYLPVPYQPTKVTVTGDWRLASRSFTVFSAQTDTSGQHFTVTSQVASPTPEELRARSAGNAPPPDVAPSLELPSNLPTEVAALSVELTSGYTTEYDKAAAIQAYLRGPLFTYNLNGAPTGPDALSEFLLAKRTGYCEQFAGAMVVLARLAGIPARVAVGFTPGTEQADGSWLITNHDAHSWPEVWFPQAGWIRFEPTKRDESTTPPGYTFAPLAEPTGPTPSATTSTGPNAAPSAKASRSTASGSSSDSAGSGGGGSSGGTGSAVGWSAGIVALGGLLLTPAAVRRRRRRRRLRGAADTSSIGQRWREIVDTAADLGLDVPATLTPRRAVRQWSRRAFGERRMPDATFTVLMEAAYAEELERYAGSSDAPIDGGGRLLTALNDWERSFGRRVRARAVLAPRSVLAALTGWVDVVTRRRERSQPIDRELGDHLA